VQIRQEPCRSCTPKGLLNEVIAVPGEGTTSELLLKLFLAGVRCMAVPHERILDEVTSGRVAAGVAVHESILEFERHGLHAVADLGMRWKLSRRMPTPLSVCVVRADLPEELIEKIVRVLRRSLSAVREAPDAALRYAASFTRGLGIRAARKLVEAHVTEDSYDLGDEARAAVGRLVVEAQQLAQRPGVLFAGAA